MSTVGSFELWTAVRKAHGVGPKTIAKLVRRLSEEGTTLVQAATAGAIDPSAVGIREEWISEARASLSGSSLELPPHVRVMTADDENYPTERVSVDLPLSPVLYLSGNSQLLTAGGVAISGARKAPEQALSYAGDVAAALAREGINVISGHAGGVDEAAHVAALRTGGTTTIVAPEGLSQFRPKRSLDLSDDEAYLIVSEFDLDAVWSGFRAMQRNSTVAALADVVVVVASGVRGGSWAQGELCLRAGKRLLVPDVPESIASGNRRLIEMGAIPLDPKQPEAVIEQMHSSRNSEADQLRLLS